MPLNPPVAPVLSSITPTSFTITRQPDGNPGGTFYLFAVSANAVTKYANSFGALQVDPIYLTTPTITLVALVPNTTYAVSLAAAVDSVGTGQTPFGPAAIALTLANPPQLRPFQNVFATTVTAEWGQNLNPPGTQYIADLSLDPGFATGVMTSGPISSLGYTFSGLTSASQYYGRVRAQNSATVPTVEVSLGSIITPAGPLPVRGMNVINLIAERGFLIEWQPNIEVNIVQYRIYRSPSPTDASLFTLIANTPAAVTNYVDHVPFQFGIVFYYKVTAVDNGGNESNLALTTAFQDNSFHSFEEQPFSSLVPIVNNEVNDETPTGVQDNVNTTFMTLFTYEAGTLQVYVNGVRQIKVVQFNEGSAPIFTLVTAPKPTDYIRVNYDKLS
jgi:hypothetical protein